MYNKWIGILLAVLLIVFAFWETTFSNWIIAAIGIILLIKILFPKKSGVSKSRVKPEAKPIKKK